MENEAELAGIADRILAFGVDAMLCFGGYALSRRLAFPNYPLSYYPAERWWWLVWVGAFLLYQVFFASEGRATLGGRLAGIRVAEPDGSDLSMNRAFLRTAFFPISAVSGLGLLWALFTDQRQCWHDFVAGSTVIRGRPQTPFGRGLAAVGAAILLVAMGGTTMWRLVWSDRYDDVMTLKAARVGLDEVSRLEDEYQKKNGAYADNLFDLAPLSDSPDRFMKDMANVFDLDRGFQIRVSSSGYTVVGHAQDDAGSKVTLTVP